MTGEYPHKEAVQCDLLAYIDKNEKKTEETE